MTVPFPGGSLTHSWYPNGWPHQTKNLTMPGTTYPATNTFSNFDGRGFLTSLQNFQNYSGGGILTSSFTQMTYDAAGNRLGETSDIPAEGSAPDASRKLTFGYDENNSSATANRDVLESEISGPYGSGSGAYHDSYSNGFGADAAYNLTNFSLDGSSQGMSPNPDNQDTHFTFDGDGNPASYQGATLTFDPEDRLTMITGGGMAGPFSAGYDGDGLRAWKRGTLPGTSSPVTTYFLYDDGGHPILEETWNGSSATLSAVNLWEADGWRARYSPGGQFYAFSFDPQGNVIQRQNSGNALGYTYDTASYEAYGHRGADYDTGGMTPAPVQSPAGFGGQFGYYTDLETGNATAPGTGLLCLTHRYYDPGTGRFLTRDPSGYGGGVNLYGFADDNPVNGIDPSGLAEDEGGANDTVRFSMTAFIPVKAVSIMGLGFNGNNRGFSAHSGLADAGDSKIMQNGSINLSTSKVTFAPTLIGRTRGVSGLSGWLHYHGHASNTNTYAASHFLGFGFNGEYEVTMSGEVGNPFFVGLAPPIRYNLTITFDHMGNVIGVTGFHSAFPAFEIYTYSNGRAPRRVYQYNPYAHGRNPLSLPSSVDIATHSLVPLSGEAP